MIEIIFWTVVIVTFLVLFFGWLAAPLKSKATRIADDKAEGYPRPHPAKPYIPDPYPMIPPKYGLDCLDDPQKMELGPVADTLNYTESDMLAEALIEGREFPPIPRKPRKAPKKTAKKAVKKSTKNSIKK